MYRITCYSSLSEVCFFRVQEVKSVDANLAKFLSLSLVYFACVHFYTNH